MSNFNGHQNLGCCDDSICSRSSSTQSVVPNFELKNYNVLEQYQTAYLLQNPTTKLFCIHENSAVHFETTQWPVAYRTWLNWRRLGTQSSHADLCASYLHDCISEHQLNPQYGQLLYGRDPTFTGLLCYSIQLSETVALRWTPSVAQPSFGTFRLEKVGRRQHRLAKWVEPQPQSVITVALHYAIELFHHRWEYSLHQFNSEHCARLVVTGQCCSFQTQDILAHQHQVSTASHAREFPEILESNLKAALALRSAIAEKASDLSTP